MRKNTINLRTMPAIIRRMRNNSVVSYRLRFRNQIVKGIEKNSSF